MPLAMLRIEWSLLHRCWGIFPMVLACCWLALAALQEPLHLRAFEYELYWTGVEGLGILISCCLPLAWLLQSAEAREGLHRVVRSPLRSVATNCFSITTYGFAQLSALLATSITLDRIRGAGQSLEPVLILAESTLVLAAGSALAVALWWTRWSAPMLVAAWIAAVTAGILTNAPIPLRLSFLLQQMGGPPAMIPAALAAALCVFGSLSGAVALAARSRYE